MSTEEAEVATDVVLGTLLVNSVLVKVLFDSGASHSYLSTSFASLHDIPLEPLRTHLLIRTPSTEFQTAMVSHQNEIVIGGQTFFAYLTALSSFDFDVILRMD